jgi:hypothetical protein
VVSVADPYGRIIGFLDRSHYVFFFLSCTDEAKWTPLQIRYFSENQVAQGIELGPLDL